MPLIRRRCWPVVLLLWIVAPAVAHAQKPDVGSAAPSDPVLIVRFGPVDDAAANPVVAQLLTAVQSSPELTRRLDDAAADPRYAAAYALAERLELPLDELVVQLAERGGFLAVTRELPPKFLVGLKGRDEALPGRLVEQLTQMVVEASGGNAAAVPVKSMHGLECRQVGPLWLTSSGSDLLVANDPLTLQAALGRWVDADSADAVNDGAPAPLLTADLDLATLKLLPQTYAPLALPNGNPQLVAFLGGWIDVLRQFNRLSLTIADHAGLLQLTVRAHTPSSRSYDPGVPGFWADEQNRPAPRLHVPREIYSASWYRDYGAMWSQRDALLEAGVLEKLAAADEAAATQFEVFGTHLPPSSVITNIGPRFRVVLAQTSTSPYDVAVNDPLPAAALCVELKDESAFRDMVSPIFRTLGLILAGEQQIAAVEHDYRDARLTVLSLSEQPDVVRRGSLARYNFRVTHTMTRGHFIAGTTPEIVQDVIDALDNESLGLDPIETGETEQQSLDLRAAADAIGELRNAIERGLILNAGWTDEEARQELQVWTQLLEAWQSLTTSTRFDDGSFEYSITIGK
jgi:hypothetical protein